MPPPTEFDQLMEEILLLVGQGMQRKSRRQDKMRGKKKRTERGKWQKR